MAAILQTNFHMHFLFKKNGVFIQISLKYAPKGRIVLKKVNIGSGNALAPNMQPAITWINADQSG